MSSRLLSLSIAIMAIAANSVFAAAIPMTGGRTAVFRSTPIAIKNKATLKFVKDTAIAPLTNPVDCPTHTPTLRIRASNGYDTGAIDLPCGNWTSTNTGFKYKDKLAASGGVKTILYGRTKLVVKLIGESYPALVGPLDEPTFVEVRLDTGSAEYCGRFESFKKNETTKIQANHGSVACLSQEPQCPAGHTCSRYDIIAGPGELLPADDGNSTWLRIFDFTGAGVVENATNGAFGPSPIELAKGVENGDGIASLEFVGPAYLGASFLDVAQGLGTTGTVCVKVEQDPMNTGWIDCDGGTGATIDLSVDSNGAGPATPPVLTTASGPAASPAGEAVVHVRLRLAIDPANDADCSSVSYLGTPSIASAFTTGQATSTITDDWINGAPGVSPNTVSLGGVPLSCETWTGTNGATSSLVAPLHTMDFLAPVLGQVVDVAQVLRLELVPTDIPPGPTPSPTATPTPTPSPTPSPSPTPTPSPTPVPTATTFPATIGSLSLTDATNNYGPEYQAFGNCYEQVKTSSSILAQDAGTFSTRLQQSVATDCEAVLTGGGGIQADAPSSYTIGFDITCPAGSTYEIRVATSAEGDFTINRDNGDGCDLPFFGSTGLSTASLGAVFGSQTGGTLAAGNLSLPPAGGLTSAPDANLSFFEASSAIITGSGTGAARAHTLAFAWDASCSSNGDAFDTGSECAVRLGLESDISPNGISGCIDADDYPGVGDRTAADDGHFVEVVAECTMLTAPPTPTPTPTPPGPTPSPTPEATPSPTPTAAVALGTLTFSVETGEGGYCPSDSSSGSFLKTQGNPTGGIPGTVCSGTQGNFSSGPLTLVGGTPNADGIAALSLGPAVVLGANLDTQTPDCGSQCVACWRLEDDPFESSFVDCDGGSNADVVLAVDSNDTSAPPAPGFDPGWVTVPAGADDDGSGAAILYLKVRRLRVNGSSTCPSAGDATWNAVTEENVAFVTGQATTTIGDRRQCPGSLFGTGCPSASSYEVSLQGANLDCGNWTENSGGRLVTTFANLDENIGGSFGTGDIAQVLRLDD